MTYYVSPQGNDVWSGTLAAPNTNGTDGPFRTLTRAGEAVKPGDTCILRSGVYHETLRPACSGKADKPVLFRAAENETPVISGADMLGGWRTEKDGLWSASMTWDMEDQNQIFADGVMLTEARWPNNTGPILQPVRAIAAGGSQTTIMDPAIPGGADAWKGALLWCCGGDNWICWAATVTGYNSETHTLTFEGGQPQTDKQNYKWYLPRKGSEYVLMGLRAALDAPGEWWYDRENRRLWLCLSPGCRPDTLLIEAKARLTCIDLRDREHIRLVGLHFLGGGILTNERSRHLRLERLKGEYVAHSFRRDVSENAVLIAGEHNVVNSCEFAFSSGSVLRMTGRENKLINCFIHEGDYTGLWGGTLAVSGRRQVVSHNTVQHSGRDLVTVHGLMESLIQCNHLSYAGCLTCDLGIIYGHTTDFANTVIRWNLVHDNLSKRDGHVQNGNGIYFDPMSLNVIVHHNAIWNITGVAIYLNNPSYFNLIAHNSEFKTNMPQKAIGSFDHANRQDLFGTRHVNEIVNSEFKMPPSTILQNNLQSADPGYTDPENLDFTLKPKSPARGAARPLRGLNKGTAPDLGAFPSEQPVWKAGHNFANPPLSEPEWEAPDVQYMNRIINSAFEFVTLEGWTPIGTGLAELVQGNGWGDGITTTESAPTPTGRYELRLSGQAGVEQIVTGLLPKTRYQLSAWLKVAGPAESVTLEARDLGGKIVAAECRETQWKRVIIEFTTGPQTNSARIVLRKTAGTNSGHAWADNFGLIELD